MRKKKITKWSLLILAVLGIGYYIFFGADIIKEKNRLKEQYNYAKEEMNKKNYENASNIFKELGNYKDSKGLSIENKYLYTKYLIDNKNYTKAYSFLIELGDYEDCLEIAPEIRYLKAVQLSESNDDYKEAVEELTSLDGYRDSVVIIDKLKNKHKYDGTWIATKLKNGTTKTWIINGAFCYLKSLNDSTIKYDCTHSEKEMIVSYKQKTEYVFEIKDNKMYYEYDSLEGAPAYIGSNIHRFEMVKTSDSTILPSIKIEPKIGMTKNQVNNSTWGLPVKVNKTTTTYGTKEQWCYNGNKYIYFDESGYVTTIQDY